MFEALFVAGLIFIATTGGKAVLIMLTTAPVIGGFAAWYMHLMPDSGPGLSGNVLGSVMAAQVVLLVLALILYGPATVRKAVVLLRTRRARTAN